MKGTDYYIIRKSPAEGACEKAVEAKERQFSVPLIHFPIVPPVSVFQQRLCFLLFSVTKHGELKKQEIRGRWKK